LRDDMPGEAVGHLRRVERALPPLQRVAMEVNTFLQEAIHRARGEELLLKRAVPANTQDWLDLATEAARRGARTTAAVAYRTAFAAEPRLVNDLAAHHRYNAACCAALAASGKGKDGDALTRADWLAWRLRALTWLRADLTARQKQLKSWWPGQAGQARDSLRRWQTDADLAGLRDAKALAKLPAEERETCRRLWAEVSELLKKAAEKPK
jgi:hypothetical protein